MNNNNACMSTPAISVAVCSALLLSACARQEMPSRAEPPSGEMSFFVSSTGSGKGGDLGGLSGADQLCQSLAQAVGSRKTWRAYLSTNASPTTPTVNARDRIGSGPWYNAQGVLIASTVENLHADNKINKQTALTERGVPVNGRGDQPNLHDILTGSQPDGRAYVGDKDTTCGNWTNSGEGAAVVGHHDRLGLSEEPPAKSWNSSHLTRGCSQEALATTGGAGRLYCFALK
jgi:hypothetical protein